MTFLGQTIYAQWGYRPETIPAIEWSKKSNGRYTSSDRGLAHDKYYAEFVYQDTIANIYAFSSLAYSNIEDAALPITFGVGEEIFGAEIVPGTYNCTIVEIGQVNRVDNVYANISLRLLLTETPTKVAIVGDFDHIVYGYQYTSGRQYEIKTFPTMSSVASTVKAYRGFSSYVFTGTFILTHEEMQYTREFLLTDTRAYSFVLPTLNEVKPFGTSVSEPHTVKIVDWKDDGRYNLEYWGITLTMVRH